jgi:hypothetical protein
MNRKEEIVSDCKSIYSYAGEYATARAASAADTIMV